jgi:dihydroflavonol-4-reductase
MQPNPAFWTNKLVCVTGGTGFLGWHLVRQLRELGASVRVLALEPRPRHPIHTLSGVGATWGDVCDPATVRRAVAGCEVVFHTAGPVGVWGKALERMHAVHVEGTRNVLEAAPEARIVHTSSITAVGASKTGEPVTEQTPFNLDSLRVDYVHAKRAAEKLAWSAAERGRHVLLTNPGYLVGPEDYERSVMGRFCVQFWRGRMPFAPPGGINLVDVRDVVRGQILAAEHGRPGRRYILGGEDCTLADFLRRLADTCGWRPRAVPTMPAWLLHGMAGLAELGGWLSGREPYPALQHVRLNRWYWYCRSDRARSELDWEPRPLAESLADAYRWWGGVVRFRSGGWLKRWWYRPERRAA